MSISSRRSFLTSTLATALATAAASLLGETGCTADDKTKHTYNVRVNLPENPANGEAAHIVELEAVADPLTHELTQVSCPGSAKPKELLPYSIHDKITGIYQKSALLDIRKAGDSYTLTSGVHEAALEFCALAEKILHPHGKTKSGIEVSESSTPRQLQDAIEGYKRLLNAIEEQSLGLNEFHAGYRGPYMLKRGYATHEDLNNLADHLREEFGYIDVEMPEIRRKLPQMIGTVSGLNSSDKNAIKALELRAD